MLNHDTIDSLPNLIAEFTQFADAGIDPAFDNDAEELERQFAELRLTFDHN